MLETLDDAAVHRWCGGSLAALRAHQHEIDELNVYPVPDGDTGTNLVLTLMAAAEALTDGARPAAAQALEGEIVEPEAGTPLGRAMRRMARGALLGARGNSGVIVSQILRGMADSFATAVAVRGGELARALRTASEAAYAAVARPVEGTVLSVAAAAAEGAGRIKSDDLVAVARAAARSAAEALARTPQQLPVLAQAGVVDAGGRGLCLLLDALVEALSGTGPSVTEEGRRAADVSAEGRPATVPDLSGNAASGGSTASVGGGPAGSDPVPPSFDATAAPDTVPGAGAARREVEKTEFGYEVQYLLDATPAAVGRLRTTLDQLGDSLVIVGTGEGERPTWNVHVHVDDIGAAVEAGVEAGRPHRIEVTRLEDRLHLTDGRSEDATGGHASCMLRDPGTAEHASGERSEEQQHASGERAEEQQHASGERAEEQPGSAEGSAGGAGSGGVTVVMADDLGAADSVVDALPTPPEAALHESEDGLRGAVVVAAGDGLTALFEAEGATVVDRNPSIAEILDAIVATGARRVVLLPNDTNTHAVATAAAREAAATGVRVSVVPTRSPVQALAALAVRDGGREFGDDVIAMAEAAGSCRYGEVCTAQREALTVAGRCRPGDLLGLVDGEVHIIGGDLTEVSRRLLDRMLGGGGELTTLVLGAGAPPGLEETLREHVTRTWPFVELQCYAGGQPRYHVLVGVE